MWISLGLCWGQTASVHGKASFPYAEAALRAVSLWTRLTPARVAVTLVQAPQLTAGQLDQLRAYTAQLVSRARWWPRCRPGTWTASSPPRQGPGY